MATSFGRSKACGLTIVFALALGACGTNATIDLGEAQPTEAPEQPTAEPTPVPEPTVAPTPVPAPTPEPVPTEGPTPVPTVLVVEPVAVTQEFCDASADVWVANEVTEYADQEDPAQVELVFALIQQTLVAAIKAAPSDELAEPAIVAFDLFDPIATALADYDFVFEDLLSSPEVETLGSNADEYDQIIDLLEEFLVDECGLVLTDLDAVAMSVGDEIMAAAADLAELMDDDTQIDFREIEDPTGRIRVRVPATWISERGAPAGGPAELILSPDVEMYLSSWDIDGVQISSIEVNDGMVDWRTPMLETAAATDCTLLDSLPYSDLLYTGTIDSYGDCPGGGTAWVIGATDDDQRFEVLVQLQFDTTDTDNDQAAFILILDSFEVR